MEIKLSLQDVLGQKLAPVIRCVNDKKIAISGSQASVLRILTGAPAKDTVTDWVDLAPHDVLGESTSEVQTQIVDDVIITYPFAKVELFERYNNGAYASNPIEAIDTFEFLPITMKVPFNGDFEKDAIELQKGDLIIDLLKNAQGKFLPIILEVKRLVGDFSKKHLVSQAYELSLYRSSNMETDIRNAIDTYIQEYQAAWDLQFNSQ